MSLKLERKGKEHCNSNCLAGCSIAMKALKAQGSPVVLFSRHQNSALNVTRHLTRDLSDSVRALIRGLEIFH